MIGQTVDYRNNNITIFGLGKSGASAAKKTAAMGARVMITENKPAGELDPQIVSEIQGLGIKTEFGGHTGQSIKGADLIVVSPGVRLDLPILKEAKKRGIKIISEVELAFGFFSKPLIAVTGTNGKTTTTTLIGEMIGAGGKKAAVAGNIGVPLIDIDDSGLDFIVAEISSYQLEAIDAFKPWIGVILNIQPDHLERHHTMEEYIRQKARVFLNQTGDDYIIYNQDNCTVAEMVQSARARRVGFSKSAATEIITLPPAEIKIKGVHNLENALAAACAAYLCGVTKDKVAEVLRTFPGVEHRIEYVTALGGVEFYNDSKGTNPDSTLVAIDTFPERGIILILGGREKGVSIEQLCRRVKEKVKAVVLVGEAAGKFESALQAIDFSSIYQAGFSMEEAVRQSFALASPGEVVLLSPACASFDMYNNFEERGRAFKTACQNLKG
jgi:UDP-N-acetylmuramoylalanine--D-glutamate ligase